MKHSLPGRARWCIASVTGPRWARTAPPAVASLMPRMHQLSMPLMSMQQWSSLMHMVHTSSPAMPPFAPLSIREPGDVAWRVLSKALCLLTLQARRFMCASLLSVDFALGLFNFLDMTLHKSPGQWPLHFVALTRRVVLPSGTSSKSSGAPLPSSSSSLLEVLSPT